MDPLNGNIYGHVVAGDIKSGCAYIIPTYQVQKDIYNRFGTEFTIATTEDYVKSQLLHLEPEDPTVRSLSGRDEARKQAKDKRKARWEAHGLTSQEGLSYTMGDTPSSGITEPHPEASSTLVQTKASFPGNSASLPTQSPQPDAVPKQASETTWKFSLSESVKKLFRLRQEKNNWPNPELSIGDSVRPLGASNCWSAVGPAWELWDNRLRIELKDFISGLEFPSHPLLTIELYMVGEQPKSAVPTILLYCSHKAFGKRVKRMIKPILENYPGIECALISSPRTAVMML